MRRRIIEIDEEKCNGCGACASACHEGAIAMIDGKAKLIRDDYCDGLGNCLPACPTGAITFVEREAAPYDKEAVEANMAARRAGGIGGHMFGGCPGSAARTITREEPQHKIAEHEISAAKDPLPCGCPGANARALVRDETAEAPAPQPSAVVSRLSQWPVQIKLVPVNAPYLNGAKLLIAADCAAFARADFHERYIKGRVTLVGCPKLDGVDYAEKLTEIIKNNDIRDVTIVRMEVPCCGGIEDAAKRALMASGKFIPWQVVTISVNGEILE